MTRLLGDSVVSGLGVNWVVMIDTRSVVIQLCSAAGGPDDPA